MLTRIIKNTGIVARLRGAWKHDVEEVLKPLRKDVRRINRDIETLQVSVQNAAERAARGDQVAAQVKWTLLLNEQQREQLAQLPRALDRERIAAHVRSAVAAAPLLSDPFEHVVVENVLPEDVYRLALEAIPPQAFFGERDPIKQDLRLPIDFAPALSSRVWNFIHETVAQTMLQPAVMAKFDEPLQRHYDEIFGAPFRDRANALVHQSANGRLMLRRPGYQLTPHRDPKRSFLTCLLYIARPGDNEAYGTQLYRVAGDHEASYKQTYYPEQEGGACELAKMVPFRANTMLAFLNTRGGAHGAGIPADAPPDTERYAYQFYVAPKPDMLSALVRQLPPERRAMWQNKNRERRTS